MTFIVKLRKYTLYAKVNKYNEQSKKLLKKINKIWIKIKFKWLSVYS